MNLNKESTNKSILLASKLSKNKGFTLIELVMVIMLLGIVSVGAGGIIKLSSQIFVDVSNRDELIASVRFSVERLNRDIRSALPNSVRTLSFVGNTVQCIEFIPSVVSAVYTDIPVTPELASEDLSLIKFDSNLFSDSLNVVVYPLNTDEVYGVSSKRYSLASQTLDTTGNEWTVKLNNASTFAEDSPTSRLYFVDQPIAYCASAGQLIRYSNYGYDGAALNGDAALMAEGLEMAGTSFTIEDANLVRNSLVNIKLQFSKNDEFVNFYNQVQVQNVP